MTVTPVVVEEEEVKKPEAGFAFPPNETNLAVISGIIALVIVLIPGTWVPGWVKAIGIIFAFLWGTDSVRKTSKYGLGTGVPSIGVLATGYGVIGGILAIVLVKFFMVRLELGYLSYAGAIIGVLLMGLIGYISGVFSNHKKIIGMDIPGLERGMAELGMAGTLAMLLQFSIVAGSLEYDAVLETVLYTGLIALMFVLTMMGMFNGYNACLGPDEKRPRTLLVPVYIAGLLCLILGFVIVGMAIPVWDMGRIVDGSILILFSAVVLIFFYAKFLKACVRGSHSVVGSGMIKTIE